MSGSCPFAGALQGRRALVTGASGDLGRSIAVALARAGAEAATSVMVGDSLKADVHGALAAGMRAVLLRRSGDVPADVPPGVPVIHALTELAAHL